MTDDPIDGLPPADKLPERLAERQRVNTERAQDPAWQSRAPRVRTTVYPASTGPLPPDPQIEAWLGRGRRQRRRQRAGENDATERREQEWRDWRRWERLKSAAMVVLAFIIGLSGVVGAVWLAATAGGV